MCPRGFDLQECVPATFPALCAVSCTDCRVSRRFPGCFCCNLMPDMLHAVSKTALLGLTKALAEELGQQGIRVNCVAPGRPAV